MRLEEDQNSKSGYSHKSELSGAVKGRERSTIPSIYAQRLFMRCLIGDIHDGVNAFVIINE